MTAVPKSQPVKALGDSLRLRLVVPMSDNRVVLRLWWTAVWHRVGHPERRMFHRQIGAFDAVRSGRFMPSAQFAANRRGLFVLTAAGPGGAGADCCRAKPRTPWGFGFCGSKPSSQESHGKGRGYRDAQGVGLILASRDGSASAGAAWLAATAGNVSGRTVSRPELLTSASNFPSTETAHDCFESGTNVVAE